MKRNLLISIGFCLFVLGLISLFLSLSGVVLTILKPLESLSVGVAYGVKLLMVIMGFVLAYIGYLDETDYLDEDEVELKSS